MQPFTRRNAILIVFTALCSTPLPALAWNKAGHMVSGAIAYDQLKQESPKTVTKVISLLKQHPEYKTRWQPLLKQVSPPDRDLYLFMLAARWSDDARDEPQFDRPTWHYVNFPYQPGSTSADVPSAEPGKENILTALSQNTEVVTSNASNSERAVALCWMFHLTGDIHQPLHTSKLVNEQYPLPDGDRGGTRFYIRVKPESKTISLHKFWDDLILGAQRFQSARNAGTKLRQSYPKRKLGELSNVDFQSWAGESFKLSGEKAYLNGSLKGSSNKDDGVLLPTNYAKSSKQVAERRMALAGYRLADSLRRAIAKLP